MHVYGNRGTANPHFTGAGRERLADPEIDLRCLRHLKIPADYRTIVNCI